MNIVKFLFLQSWKLLLFALGSGVIGGLCGAGLATVIAASVTGGAADPSMGWTFFGLCLGSVLFKSGSAIALIHLSQAATLHLRVELSRKFLATPHVTLRAIGKAECQAILTNDIMAFSQAFQSIPQALSDAVLVVVCLGYMAWISWQLFLVFAVVLAASVLAYHFAERIPLQKMKTLRQQVDALYSNFRNLIEGSKELQLNARRGAFFVERVVAADARKFRGLYIETMTGYTWLANIGAVMFFLVIGALLFGAPAWSSMPAAVLMKFTLILLYLIGPITTLTTGLPMLAQAGISLRRIQQFDGSLGGAQEAAAADAPDRRFARDGALELELRQVCHRYAGDSEDKTFMLGPLDLRIAQGEILFIVGGNGSGKTTLAMLVLGFYRPEAGALLLNGVPVDETNVGGYQAHFSAVFADFHLFRHLLGDETEAVGASANAYLKKFCMDHKVQVADGQFSTIELSTGQRKRLALVAAYLEDRPIYLFDEWAADQDPLFKRIFYTELLPDLKARGKTVIVITHDDAYFPYADRVVKIEGGQLSEIAVPAIDPARALHVA